MQPRGIHHVSINVHDAQVAIDFYVGVLGMTMRDDRPNFPFAGAWLDVGGQQVHLLQLDDVPADVGQHVAFDVDDLDAVVDELRGRGVAVSTPKAVGRGRQAFLHDPSGNRIELNQPPT